MPAGAELPRQHAELDFWLGEWDCRRDDGQGSSLVEKILDGRVIQAQFDGRPGRNLQGRSLSAYDTGLGKWRQTWADNQGGYLDLIGGRDGAGFGLQLVRLSEDMPFKRIIFDNVAADGFDWRWQSSIDRGAIWQTAWYARYSRASG